MSDICCRRVLPCIRTGNKGVRHRHRQTDKQTDRQTQTDTDRHRQTQTQIDRQTQTDRETDRQTQTDKTPTASVYYVHSANKLLCPALREKGNKHCFCLSVHLSVAYIANNSRNQRPSVPKFKRKVPHLRCDSHTSFKVKWS